MPGLASNAEAAKSWNLAKKCLAAGDVHAGYAAFSTAKRLLDEQGQPKPVYHVLDELINQEWHTEKRGLLSEDGRLRFRGFYGTYAIRVEHEGVWFEGTFAHEKETKDFQLVELRTR
mgnify:CR=1 FL=1